MIYDATLLIRDSLPVWPGDPSVSLTPRSHLARDHSHTVRLTSIQMGSHTGTHIDAPHHFIDGGKTLDQVPVDQFIGPATVFEIDHVRSISPRQLEKLDWSGVERVLFKTENSRRWKDGKFYEDFVYLEPEGAQFLVEHGIRLVGIDYLSVDPYKSVKHPSHFVLLRKDVVIVEGLNLADVPPGRYQLVALPLHFERADGAPARVILIS